ncbi:MAG: cobalt-precorrin-6A reductase [Burkholderia sp.]|nr:cobalt-precorrin-6A reductase [Burkholderia sp.]
MSCSRTILLLGGTGDALKIARVLSIKDIYSLSGLGRVPDDLMCTIRTGGFGGAVKLASYLRDKNISLVIDATHPYAKQISENAIASANDVGILCWSLRRKLWLPNVDDNWHFVDNWSGIDEMIRSFYRPLFTLGREPLMHLNKIPPHQFWTIRCLYPHPGNALSRIIAERGPFTIEAERSLIKRAGIDIIISKNSGGTATKAKIDVARELGLPVVMLRRPSLPDSDLIFYSVDELLSSLYQYK